MAAEVETIRCNFIGDFKVGDNILVNGNALCRLSATNENNTFNKLMVVQVGSIVEAALDQIIYRARSYTREGVPSIPVEDLYKIRGSKIERFNNIIQTMKTRKLLDGLGGTIYDDLHRLRKLRNRVHIPFDDEPEGLGRDDHLAFSAKEVIWSLSLCVRVLVSTTDEARSSTRPCQPNQVRSRFTVTDWNTGRTKEDVDRTTKRMRTLRPSRFGSAGQLYRQPPVGAFVHRE
jgi:hypothetical protein